MFWSLCQLSNKKEYLDELQLGPGKFQFSNVRLYHYGKVTET